MPEASVDPAATLGYGDGHDALIRATVRVIAQKGLRGMTFRAVAEEAGVKNSLITYHFGNRDALLVEAVKWVIAQSLSISLPSDIKALDTAFARQLLTVVQRDPDIQVFHYEVLLEARRNPKLHDLSILLVQGYIEGMETILRQHGHPRPEVLARLLYTFFDGLVLQQLTTPSLAYTDEALELLSSFVQEFPHQ